MQDIFVYILLGVAVVYLGWKWFGKSGSSCGCGCECSISKGADKNCPSAGDCNCDSEQKKQ